MRFVFAVLSALSTSGCSLIYSAGIGLVYEGPELPDAQVIHDIRYLDGSDDPKHRLDLFLPTPDSVRAAPWPTVIFVHGGGWTEGDKDLAFGGVEVYGNIGRYFASRGIGAVTVNYRLLPGVAWLEQIEDVAAAVEWVGGQVALYGGDPGALFLMGHSAGAQLATHVALDPAALPETHAFGVCGVIAVSGAAYDLTDEETYALSNDPAYYARRFNPAGTDPDWQTDASPVRFASSDAPPFLIIYAGGESRALQRQSRLLDAALTDAGAEADIVIVPGQSHERIVLALSRDDETAGPGMLGFARGSECFE
ncbi:MAG: alpha/beta hydrolase [Bacteroidota bacterium]